MPSRRRHSSVEGCCICGVDASSEPFLKSDSISAIKSVSSQVFQCCFKISEERSGDLCVDCLSAAKKWLKLDKRNRKKKDFSELVDSRRSPNNYCTRKRPRRNSALPKEKEKNIDSKEIEQIAPKLKSPCDAEQENNDDKISKNEVCNDKEDALSTTPTSMVLKDMLSDDEVDAENNDEMDATIAFQTPCLSPGIPEDITGDSARQDMVSVATQTAFLFPALTSPQANANKLPFIDLSKWRQEDICCGTIFRGPNGEVLVDPKWLRSSCVICNRSSQPPTPIEKSSSESISVFDEKLASLCS